MRGGALGAAVALGDALTVSLEVIAAGKASSEIGSGLIAGVAGDSVRSVLGPAAEASSRTILPLIATRLAMTTSTVNPV